MTVEHERRFLVDGPVPDGPEMLIKQAYFTKARVRLTETELVIGTGPVLTIPLPPETVAAMQAIWDKPVIRLRQQGDEWFVTVKGPKVRGRGLEEEYGVDAAIAQQVYARADGGSLVKVRRRVKLPMGLIAEVDTFLGHQQPLRLVEVEDMPDDLDPPAWFGPEITDRYEFANAALAKGWGVAGWAGQLEASVRAEAADDAREDRNRQIEQQRYLDSAEPCATEDLYGADEKCHHRVVPGPGGGIRCLYCGGWFCY